MPLCSCRRLLEHALRGAISNAIKGFGFPHWTPIGFQMRWSKARSNIGHMCTPRRRITGGTDALHVRCKIIIIKYLYKKK
jgi:hypothetical protein